MAIFRGVGGSGDSSDNSFLDEVTAQAQAAEASATAAANSATSALNTELTSASFNTSNGVLTLTKQDGDTVTTDLDGRFLLTETDPVFSAHAASGVTSTKITNWDTSYNDKINAVSFSSSNNTLTLTQQDGSTLTTVINGSLTGGGETLAETLAIGNTTGGNDISFGDNDKAKFGASDDLEIYHDGSNSRIVDSGTGYLKIQATDRVAIRSADDSERMADFYANADVKLYYDNAQKLATTATGIDVTGTVTADGLTVDGTINAYRAGFTQGVQLLGDSGGNQIIGTATNDKKLIIKNQAATQGIEIIAGNRVMDLAKGGDISFYEDTGTTPKFFWDASAESLGIGTTSPSDKLEVASSSSVNIKLNNTGNNTSLLLGAQATAARLTAGSGDKLGLGANDTADGLVLDTSNNVGIGTTAPAEKLEVQGRVVINNSYGYRIGGTSSGDAHVGDLTNTSGVLTLRTEGNRNMRFDTNGSERMRIDSSGNVGIGTTSPSADLHVKTDATGSGVTPTADTGLFIDGQYSTTLQLGAYWAGQTQINFGTGSGPGGSQTPIKGQIAYNNYSNYMAFRTGGTERFRCTSGGQLLVGTTSSQDTTSKILTTGRVGASSFLASSNNSQFYDSGNYGYAGITLYSYLTNSATTQKMMSFKASNGTEYGAITISGTTVTYGTGSDERLKENIRDAGDAGDKIDAIKIRQFDWKESGQHQDYGVIAQELDEVAPEAVAKGYTEDDMMSVDYSKLVPTLIKEIQSLRNRVAELEKN